MTNAFAGIAFDVSTEKDADSIGASINAVRDTSAGATAGNHDANLVFRTNDAGDDAIAERMRITHDGLVGIGTTDPAGLLDIHSTTGNQLRLSYNANYYWLLERDSNGKLNITNHQNDTDVKAITIDTTEQVGIGTSSPSHKLEVNGSFAATTKSFDIEHPTKEGMRLHHGSLEGPEHGVYIRGKNNSGTIYLPDYWVGLVDEDSITVQLTAIGKPQQLYVRAIEDNKVRIAAKTYGENIDYYYFIQAERKDVDKVEVEY